MSFIVADILLLRIAKIWEAPSVHTLAKAGTLAADGHSHVDVVQCDVNLGNQFAIDCSQFQRSTTHVSLLLVVFSSSLLSVELRVKPVCVFALPLALATTENLTIFFLLLIHLFLER